MYDSPLQCLYQVDHGKIGRTMVIDVGAIDREWMSSGKTTGRPVFQAVLTVQDPTRGELRCESFGGNKKYAKQCAANSMLRTYYPEYVGFLTHGKVPVADPERSVADPEREQSASPERSVASPERTVEDPERSVANPEESVPVLPISILCYETDTDSDDSVGLWSELNKPYVRARARENTRATSPARTGPHQRRRGQPRLMAQSNDVQPTRKRKAESKLSQFSFIRSRQFYGRSAKASPPRWPVNIDKITAVEWAHAAHFLSPSRLNSPIQEDVGEKNVLVPASPLLALQNDLPTPVHRHKPVRRVLTFESDSDDSDVPETPRRI